MTSTFEDQLRQDLHAATSHTAYGSIDPAQIIDEGSRVVSRRRRQRAIGSAAAVAVLAVGGFLSTDHGRNTTAPPAGPSRTASAAPVSRAVLNLSDDGTARLIAEREAGSGEVRVMDAAGTNRTVLTRLRVPVESEQITYVPLTAQNVLVGLMPRGAQLLQVSTEAVGEDTGYRSDTQILGSDLVLFGVRFDDPAQLAGLSRILWHQETGTVWDTNTPLASAQFDVVGQDAVKNAPVARQLVWANVANRTWGTSWMGSLTEKPLEPYAYNFLGGFAEDGPDQGTGLFQVAGLLPSADATNLRATWAPGVTVSSPLQFAELTSGDRTNLTAFHASVETEGELPEPLLRSISWTGTDGKQHTHSYTGG